MLGDFYVPKYDFRLAPHFIIVFTIIKFKEI